MLQRRLRRWINSEGALACLILRIERHVRQIQVVVCGSLESGSLAACLSNERLRRQKIDLQSGDSEVSAVFNLGCAISALHSHAAGLRSHSGVK